MRALATGCLALICLVACGPRPPEFVEYRLVAMATSVEITLPAEASRQHPELIASIEAELGAFERDYYAWSDGELSRLNRALSSAGTFDASQAMADLIGRAKSVTAATNGAFDPGVGALVELWGFNDATRPPSTPPSAADITATLAAAGSIDDIGIDGTRLSAGGARFTLDLGGIAKGAAIDRIVAQIESLGIAPVLVNAGGDLRVVGEPEGRSWRIGIQHPRGNGLLGTVTLAAGEAAFSSGDYERFYEKDGERLHHILDPRTGRPATHTQAVTVIAGDGTLADAAATALFVAGPDDWRAMAARLGIVLALRVGADGGIEMTPAMRDRFRPAADAGSDILAAGDG